MANDEWLPPGIRSRAPAIARLLTTPDWHTAPQRALEAFHQLVALTLNQRDAPTDFALTSTLARPGQGPGLALIHQSALIHPGSALVGDVVISAECEIGPNATVFGPTLIGPGTYLGPNVEVRRSVLSEAVKASHVCYVGHSIVGRRVNIAAQCATAVRNLRRPTVHMLVDGQLEDTTLELFGALIGDDVQMGCGVTIMPGRRIAPRRVIGPCSLVMRNEGL